MMKYLHQVISGSIKRFVVLWTMILLVAVSSCQSVKPYQRAYLDDENMKPGKGPCEMLDDNVFSYREGGVVTGGRKTKGGCWCN